MLEAEEKERCSVCRKIPQGIRMRKSQLVAFLCNQPVSGILNDSLYCSLSCMKQAMDAAWSQNVDNWRRFPAKPAMRVLTAENQPAKSQVTRGL
jgi:hypothetical protein